MIWLGLKFYTVGMTIIILQEKPMDVMALVRQWYRKRLANTYKLRTLLRMLFHIAQCCPQTPSL